MAPSNGKEGKSEFGTESYPITFGISLSHKVYYSLNLTNYYSTNNAGFVKMAVSRLVSLRNMARHFFWVHTYSGVR